jgi:hypothetical protein
LETELNLDPVSKPNLELITDPDPNLQIISDLDAQHCFSCPQIKGTGIILYVSIKKAIIVDDFISAKWLKILWKHYSD